MSVAAALDPIPLRSPVRRRDSGIVDLNRGRFLRKDGTVAAFCGDLRDESDAGQSYSQALVVRRDLFCEALAGGSRLPVWGWKLYWETSSSLPQDHSSRTWYEQCGVLIAHDSKLGRIETMELLEVIKRAGEEEAVASCAGAEPHIATGG